MDSTREFPSSAPPPHPARLETLRCSTRSHRGPSRGIDATLWTVGGSGRPRPSSDARPDVSGLVVRPARTRADREKVFDVRWEGYRKYFGARDDVVERYDFQPNATLLLATDTEDRPLGTLRILDRAHGELELDAYVDVDAIVPAAERPCIEATRFTVPRHPRSQDIKSALWKAFHDYSRANGSQSMVIWCRKGAARMYGRLMFEDVGAEGEFRHPRLGNKTHRTYKVGLSTVEALYRDRNHPLSELFFGAASARGDCAQWSTTLQSTERFDAVDDRRFQLPGDM